MKRLDARTLRAGELTPPPSKSDAQRALVLAHVLGSTTKVELGEGELPADVVRLRAGLERLSTAGAQIDCGDGGAPFRLLLGQAAVSLGTRTFVGTARLAERPHAPLIEALGRTLAASGLRFDGAPWPLVVTGARVEADAPNWFEIDASESSQFASSLLLVCAALASRQNRPWEVRLLGAVASEGYLAMTVEWLERAGFVVARDGGRYSVKKGATPSALAVPGDWSSLGYLLLCAWKTGSVVSGADLQAAHPDRAIVRVLGEVGVDAVRAADGKLRVTGAPVRGVRASGKECPDLLPTLAAFACTLRHPSVLTDVEILKAKESDRLAGIRELVAAVGGASELGPDGALTIHPPEHPRHSFRCAVRGDHRLAMSAATLAVLTNGVVDVDDTECVAKSFSGFWRELERIGATLSSAS